MLVASFPDDAVAVCFVREDDGREVGCTTQSIATDSAAAFEHRGVRYVLREPSPTGRVAVVESLIHAPQGEAVRVRAIGYNQVGASPPSERFFAVERATRRFPTPRESERHLTSRPSTRSGL